MAKGKPGRPSAYRPEILAQVKKACEAGFTDRELAELLKVSEQTINTWKIEHPEFSLALKNGKDVPDERVERSLYHRATGYSFEAVKIFMPAGASEPVYAPYTEHVPPDTTAMIFWLKNRRPETWRDKRDVDVNHSGEITHRSAAISALDELLEDAARGRADSPRTDPLPN